jgi:hypothetical protein
VQFPLLFCPVILHVPTFTALQLRIPQRNQQSPLIALVQQHKAISAELHYGGDYEY